MPRTIMTEENSCPRWLSIKIIHCKFYDLNKFCFLVYYWLLFKNSSIRLAVVSDPAKEEEDCEDIGYAFVDVNDIMDSNRNYLDQEIACNYFYL